MESVEKICSIINRSDFIWEYTHTKTERPIQSGGGTNKDVLDRLLALEQRLSELESREATGETAGLVRVTDYRSATDSTGLALAATEKNSAIAGTLANEIGSLDSRISGENATLTENGCIVFLRKISDIMFVLIQKTPLVAAGSESEVGRIPFSTVNQETPVLVGSNSVYWNCFLSIRNGTLYLKNGEQKELPNLWYKGNALFIF